MHRARVIGDLGFALLVVQQRHLGPEGQGLVGWTLELVVDFLSQRSERGIGAQGVKRRGGNSRRPARYRDRAKVVGVLGSAMLEACIARGVEEDVDDRTF